MRLVELHQRLQGFLKPYLAVGRDLDLTLFHSLVTSEQQGLGLGIALLAQEAAAQDSPGVEGRPVVGRFFFSDSQALAGGWLGLVELPFVQQGVSETI